MALRFVPVAPVSLALRALASCVILCVPLGCAGGKKGGSPTGVGGSSVAGKSGTAGTTGAGTAGAIGSGSAGTTGSGVAGTTGSGVAGTIGSGAAGTNGTGAAGTTGSGSAGTIGVAGTNGTGAAGSIGVDGGSDAACQSASYTFAPKIPTVFVLVDRSGSEFTNATSGPFFTLRTAVLNVVMHLQAQVRFGLGVFTGQNGVMCPIFTTVATDINNYGPINTAYSALGQPAFKAETPAVQVIPMVQSILQNDSGTGQKYMMFVTDAETDFCDDGSAICPADAVTYEIQSMYAGTPSIGSLIVGITDPSPPNTIEPAVLQAFANAGAGQPVALETGGGVNTATDVYNQCKTAGTAAGTSSWGSLYTASGKTTMTSLATYSATGGTATIYTPGSTSETDLENEITAALSGVKSCTFDLSDVNGKSLKVDLTKLAQANIKIEGVAIPQDATNGWSMSSQSELVLNGSACTTWRMPNNNDISFAFPCSTIIFE